MFCSIDTINIKKEEKINYLIKLSFCKLFLKRKDILEAFTPSTKISYI